ncbi:hypothetical protein [Marmoricola sp. RAF53]|uniref:hypothetical protein n=1 Tax=Marmoricola sp. RAF53 TaxID=3233059 RepID=UPI003F99A958
MEHRATALRIEVRFRQLRTGQLIDVSAYLKTDAHRTHPWQLTALDDRGQQSVDLYVSGESRCPEATARFDYERSTVTVTVPRDCLKNPAWIRAAVIGSAMRLEARPSGRDADAVWEDDAYARGYDGTPGRTWGPRLYRP